MKTGMSLQDLAAEIERRENAKTDIIAKTDLVKLDQHGEGEAATWALELPEQGFYRVTEHTHRQIATHVGVPWRYYARLLAEAPELLRSNVMHWFAETPARRMFRTLDGTARAFLSDRYKRIDNFAVMHAALPAILERPNTYVLSNNVSDAALHLKVLFRDIEAEVAPGDTVRAGVQVRNSEIGQGRLSVTGFFYRDFCTNGCVFGAEQTLDYQRTHIGGRVVEADYQVLSDETLAAEDDLILRQVGDTVKAAASPEAFAKVVDRLRQAKESTPVEHAEAAVEVLKSEIALTDGERSRVLENLIRDRDYSQWGMANAVTEVANETESYDRASELEALGGKVLNFAPALWGRIATAEPVPA